MDLQTISINSIKETEGVWYDIDGETSFLIARWRNPSFTKLFVKLTAASQTRAKIVEMDTEENYAVMMKVAARTIVLDWKGLKLNGKDLPYSPEKSEEIMLDKKYQGLHEAILEFAQKDNNYREDEIQATGKKPKNSSVGD